MRAKKVNEDLDFERGISPRSALGVGSARGGEILFDLIYEESKKLPEVFIFPRSITAASGSWDWRDLSDIDGSEPSKYFKLIMKEFVSLYAHREVYIILMESGNVYFHETDLKYPQLRDISDFYMYLNKKGPKKKRSAKKRIQESVNFERGADPKQTLRIGLKANNSWNHNPPINVPISAWKEEKTLDEVENEYIEKAAELLRTTPDQIRIDVQPLDDWDEEFKYFSDYLQSDKYFAENNTYIGPEWDFTAQEDLEGLYDQEDEILKTVPLERSAGKLHLGSSGSVYVAGPYGDIWLMLGTIY
jgi:hypothetical protein